MIKNYYEILGIAEYASQKEIKKAYLQLAQKYHPDKSPFNGNNADTALGKFVAINEAYHVLSDENKRKEYNEKLSAKAGGREHTINVTQAEMLYNYGLQALKAGKNEKAVEYFQTAIKLNPREPKYYTHLALSVIKTGHHFDKAVEACKKAIDLEIYNAEHYVALGLVHKHYQKFVEAEKHFKEALKWDGKCLRAKKELQELKKLVPNGFWGSLFGAK
ncbi:DnaJ domain-containing protein [candidate division TA06 bacterium]|uniref:DnaJ domain-containing protein n=1 Tax=candidate division TA06 bacterium TaxID=2250710 RepID=A0A933IBW0_UNCT6|nr:DnaJ domain-containing protein [candidate division TA06 bacterium]